MARLSEDDVRSLAAFRHDSAPVTSLYLDVDGRRFVRPHDYELHLERLLREARDRVSVNAESRAAAASIEGDLTRIRDWVQSGVDRSRTRGLAFFSCCAADFWRVIELPVRVRNHVVINSTPHVRQLEAIVQEYERFAVLLADRQRARVFVFELGELVEKDEQFDQLPRREDEHGDLPKDRVRDHVEAAAHQHLRRAAAVAFRVFQDQGFDHLILGVPDAIVHELERELHPYLRERIAARVSVAVNARDDEIRRAALDVEDSVERAKQAEAVSRLRDAVGSGNGGTAGLEAVLGALVERRVDTLLVSEGFEAPGWRCPSCDHVTTKGRRCPVCTASMHAVDDVVEEAVEAALAQSCRVAVCRENPDLDVLGRIGALLRF